MRIPARALMALVALAPLIGHISPAQANYTGGFAFEASVFLPTFPCGGFGCDVGFNADLATGTLAGAGAIAMVTGLTGDVTMIDSCTAGQALQGNAQGLVRLSGTNVSGSLLPTTLFPFEWTRVGLVMVITAGSNPAFVGAGLFLPTGGFPTCTGGSMSATIWGTLVAVPVNPAVPPECSDNLDNDLDGRTDYGNDAGCTDPNDTTENSDTPPPPGECRDVAGNPVCTIVTTGTVVQSVGVTTVPTASHRVVGTVDIYEFPLPTGGSVTLGCPVLSVNASTANPCALAGGTYKGTDSTLVDRTETQPGPSTGGTPVANVCNATVTITVRGIGINNFPAFTLC